jgi:hypothetical protein
MKYLNFILVVFIAMFCFSGCSTVYTVISVTKRDINSVPYSFTGNNSVTATVTLQTGIFNRDFDMRIISLNGNLLPEPEEGTKWNPVSFPAGVPLTLLVNIDDYSDSDGSLIGGWRNVDITFNCPALETGKNYGLSFKDRSRFLRGNQYFIVLVDTATESIVYEQEITLRWKNGRR